MMEGNKKFESGGGKNSKEEMKNELEKTENELSQVEKEISDAQDNALDLFTKIKNLRDEVAITSRYSPEWDKQEELINETKGEFEKNAAEADVLAEKKKIIGEKIASLNKQIENLGASKKTGSGDLN